MTQHTKENFARYLGTGQIIRRRNLSVRVAHTATNRTQQVSRQTTDPKVVAETKRRFDICKSCEHSRDNAFECDLHPGCCFGKFRSNPESQCPLGKW